VKAAALGIALVALLAGPLGTASGGQPGEARADGCVWHRHTKRVVVHVRRHGQVRRIVRIKHWWTCDSPPAPTPSRLGVQSFEFHYILSRPSVRAGDLILELSNRGEDDHNLNLGRVGSDQPIARFPDTGSGQRVSERIALEPGVYDLWCSLPQHAELGMRSTLTVTATG
jgi:hypothetical protein